MPKKIVHRDYPWLDEGSEPEWTRAVDALPKPKDLVFRIKTQPITVSVSEKTTGVYKKYARKPHIPVEHVMGAIIDVYARNTLST